MTIVYILVGLMFIFLVLKIMEIIICKRNEFTIYFGVPGSGKSTVAALLAKKTLKKNKRKVLSNFAIKGTYILEKKDIGHYDMTNTLLILDEAGVDFDNRNWKNNLDQDQVYFFKHHRHYNSDIVLFSQSLDMDCKLRNLATKLKVVKSSIIPFFIVTKTIAKKIDINKETGEIIDRYYWIPLSGKRYFSPKAWKLFNSYTRRELEIKDFERYD